jgi:hypothetical protein
LYGFINDTTKRKLSRSNLESIKDSPGDPGEEVRDIKN